MEQFLSQKGWYEEARTKAVQLLSEDPAAAMAQFDLALTWGERAVKAYERVSNKEGFVEGIFFGFGRVLTGEYEQKEQIKKAQYGLGETRDRCLVAIALLEASRGNEKRAAEHLQAAASSSYPTVKVEGFWATVEVWRRQAVRLYEQGSAEKALALLDEAANWQVRRTKLLQDLGPLHAVLLAVRTIPDTEATASLQAVQGDRSTILRAKAAAELKGRRLAQARLALEGAEAALLEVLALGVGRSIPAWFKQIDHDLIQIRGSLHYELANARALEGRWAEALWWMRPVVDGGLLSGNSLANATRQLAELLRAAAEESEKAGRWAQACLYWEEAFRRYPTQAAYAIGLATALAHGGRPDRAIRLLRDQHEQDPINRDVLRLLAEITARRYWPSPAAAVLAQMLGHFGLAPDWRGPQVAETSAMLEAVQAGVAGDATVACLADMAILTGALTHQEAILRLAHERFPDASAYLVATVLLTLQARPISSEAEFGQAKRALAVYPQSRSLIVDLRDAACAGYGSDADRIEFGLMAWRFGSSESQTRRLAQQLRQRARYEIRELKVLHVATTGHPLAELLTYAGGICLNHSRLWESASDYLNRAISADPTAVDAIIYLADLCERTGQWEPGFRAASRALELDPDHVRGHLLRGQCAVRLGELELAEADFARARELDPYQTLALLQLGVLKQKIENFGEAIASFKHMTRQSPGDYRGFYQLGRACLGAGQVGEAVDALKRAVELAPSDPIPAFVLGEAYMRKADWRAAYGSFEKAQRLRSTFESLFYMGLCAERFADLDAAERCYQEVLKERPDQVQTRINMSALHGRRGRMVQSCQAAAAALAVDPDSAPAQWNLATAAWLTESPEVAERFLSPSLLATAAPLYAATLFLRQGDLAGAERALQQTAGMADFGPAKALLGIARLRAAEPTQALALLEKASELSPDLTQMIAPYCWEARALLGESRVTPAFSGSPDHAIYLLARFVASANRVAPGLWETATGLARGSELASYLTGAAPEPERLAEPTLPLLLPEPDWQSCSEVSSYQDWEVIGGHWEGGIGTVTKVVNRRTGALGARKLLKPQLWSKRNVREKFRAEALLLARLDHPHIVRVFPESIDEAEGAFVMEWLPGGSVAALLKNRGPLPIPTVVLFALGTAEALAYYHGLDPANVHQDVSADNLLLTRDGAVKLADFGQARLVSGGQDYTQTEESAGFEGKLPYAAPEAVASNADQPSDQYSLGCVLYEMLTGRLPIEPADAEADAHFWRTAKRRRRIDPPSLHQSAIPEWLDAITMRLLEREPGGRFPTMTVAVEALRAGTANQEPSQVAATAEVQVTATHVEPDLPEPWTGGAKEFLLRTDAVGDFGDWEPVADPIEGGMATIWQVRHRRTEQLGALKRLKSVNRAQRRDRERFLKEASLLAKGRSPFLVSAIDLDYARCQYVMEWMPYSVKERLGLRPLLPFLAQRIAGEIAAALAAFAREGAWRTHLDLTPGNILLTQDLRVRLADFGVASFEAVDAIGFRGKPAYAAPEVLAGGAFDHRADQFSLGLLLYEMLTGRPRLAIPEGSPLSAWGKVALRAQIFHLPEQIDTRLSAVVRQLLSPAPSDRFADMATVAAVLNDLQRNAPGRD